MYGTLKSTRLNVDVFFVSFLIVFFFFLFDLIFFLSIIVVTVTDIFYDLYEVDRSNIFFRDFVKEKKKMGKK